jgi:hypothetical protein
VVSDNAMKTVIVGNFILFQIVAPSNESNDSLLNLALFFSSLVFTSCKLLAE